MPKIIPMPGRAGKVVAERDQMSHGRLIHVVSVFPADGACSPEDKLKTDRKSTRLNSSHSGESRMPSSA